MFQSSSISISWRRMLLTAFILGAALLLVGLAVWQGTEPAEAGGIICNPAPPTITTCTLISGTVTTNQTWMSDTVYVLYNARIPATTTVTVMEGTIIKLYAPNPHLSANVLNRSYLYVTGTLDLQGTSNAPVIFTSYRDDSYGGDTNGDSTVTQPAMSDYTEIRVTSTSTVAFNEAIVRYGHYGVRVYNTFSTTISPTISNVNFQNNYFGLTFDTANLGDITSQVQNNTFTQNMFGLGTRTTSQGASRPNLVNNVFANHDEVFYTSFITPSFPIYLNGTAFPTYSGNTFASTNRHQAIALGGAWNRSGAWPTVLDANNTPIPYVVYGDIFAPVSGGQYGNANFYPDMRLNVTATVDVPPNTIFKFYVLPPGTTPAATDQRYLVVSGTLNLQSTSSNNQILFTSYRDDTGGDTNADGGSTVGAPDNWHSVTLYNDLTTFDYVRSRFAKYGIRVYNDHVSGITIQPEIANSVFENNLFGNYLLTHYHGDILSSIHDNVYSANTFGIGTNITLCNNFICSGASRPTLANNQFNNNTGFPIYLGGTAFPLYTGSTNTFSGNTHPAIGLNGNFANDGTWALVPGAPDVPATNLPYVVSGTVNISADSCGSPATTCFPTLDIVSIPATAVFKFDTAADLVVRAFGNLDLLSTSSNDRIVFTSYKDDTLVGDTNADGGTTTPAKGNWDYILYTADQFLYPSLTKVFDYAVVKYSTGGVRVAYNGPASTNLLHEIGFSHFEENTNGAYFFIDNAGDINASIHDSVFISNTYGFTTDTDEGGFATGASRPYVYSNTFQANTQFPIWLNGTAFPIYNNPGATAPNTNQFLSNPHPAVALGSLFNCSGANCGDWAEVRSGSFRLPYVVIGDVTIGAASTVGVPPGTIIKLNTTGCAGAGAGGRCSITVNGELGVQGTSSNPVIFTSYKDDSSGGDTNGDGTTTVPGRNDWYALNLQSSGLSLPIGSYEFDYAVIKYSNQGVRVFANTASNVFPKITNNRFTENNIGLQLTVSNAGNVSSPVNNNIFISNTTSVLGSRVGAPAGRLFPVFFQNDFYGSYTTSNTFTISVPSSIVTATFNYWGDPSGPRHAIQNPTGLGVVVTNTPNSTVILGNYAAGPHQTGISYAILGRVAANDDTPSVPHPLAGATMLLSTGAFTLTNQNGNYNLSGLASGSYVVQPFLSGYSFSPVTHTATLIGADATGIDFIGTPIIGTTYNVSGQVLDLNSQPMPGVFVYAVGTSYGDVTDGSGNFSIPMLNGAYTLKAVKVGSTFLPFSRSITVNGLPITGQNFQEAIVTFLYLPLVRR